MNLHFQQILCHKAPDLPDQALSRRARRPPYDAVRFPDKNLSPMKVDTVSHRAVSGNGPGASIRPERESFALPGDDMHHCATRLAGVAKPLCRRCRAAGFRAAWRPPARHAGRPGLRWHTPPVQCRDGSPVRRDGPRSRCNAPPDHARSNSAHCSLMPGAAEESAAPTWRPAPPCPAPLRLPPACPTRRPVGASPP